MKVKHIITTFGIILGGLLIARGANAVVTYRASSDVQFTWGGSLSLTLESDDEDHDGFVITSVAPGLSRMSNGVTATVGTNNPTGYTLSATVGGEDSDGNTYSTADLYDSVNNTTIAMIGDSATALSLGTWGYTLNGTATTPTYGALSTTTAKILNQTQDSSGTAASEDYVGGDAIKMNIGAYPATDQTPGTYKNVIYFTLTANAVPRTVTVELGDGVTSVTLGKETDTKAVSGDYSQNDTVAIAATCDTANGYTFNNWYNPTDYGTIADINAASTTFAVGAGDATLTAYCYKAPATGTGD